MAKGQQTGQLASVVKCACLASLRWKEGTTALSGTHHVQIRAAQIGPWGCPRAWHRLGDGLHRAPPLNPLSELAGKRSDAQLGGQEALEGACSLGLLVVWGNGPATPSPSTSSPIAARRSSRGIAALPAWRGRGSRGSPFPRRSVCRGTQTSVARKIPLPPRQRTQGSRG